MIAHGKIRVLIVDDCAVVRKVITQVLSRDPEIEVVGTACDPYVARDKILDLHPDVLTLDIEMPRMNGLTFLRILQRHHPMPVVIISSLTQAGSQTALEALESGAVDIIAKPGSAWSLDGLVDQLALRIKGAARARLRNPPPAPEPAKAERPIGLFHDRQLVVMGASTGGTEALRRVLTRLPGSLPAICIVQHIPPVFSRAFADRLNQTCAFEVREATQGDELRPGLALVAPGDYHMRVVPAVKGYRVRLDQGPPLHHTRPAVDVLFQSAAQHAGADALGVLLTGMGSDGAAGFQQLKSMGAHTLAQDEATCVVYGMPRAAVELGAVDELLPLEQIPSALLRAVQDRAAGSSPTASCAQPSSKPSLRTSTPL